MTFMPVQQSSPQIIKINLARLLPQLIVTPQKLLNTSFKLFPDPAILSNM